MGEGVVREVRWQLPLLIIQPGHAEIIQKKKNLIAMLLLKIDQRGQGRLASNIRRIIVKVKPASIWTKTGFKRP